MKINKTYLNLTLGIFVIETLIAIFVHDEFIRPFFGDFLASIFVYTLIKSFINISVKQAAYCSLGISFGLEILQYFKVLKLIGLSHVKILAILLGTSFSWLDILAYALGILCVWFIEKNQALITFLFMHINCKIKLWSIL